MPVKIFRFGQTLEKLFRFVVANVKSRDTLRFDWLAALRTGLVGGGANLKELKQRNNFIHAVSIIVNSRFN